MDAICVGCYCLEGRIMESNKLKKVRLKGNASFNIREGWLRKGMRAVKQNPTIFSESNAMQILGVGSKMVNSIKFWLKATGLVEERINKGKHELVFTPEFGQIIYDYDPYFEDIFTLFLLHSKIASNKDYAVVWYLFFNVFEAKSFTKEDMFLVLNNELEKLMDTECTFSESLLRDDCSSVLKMYVKDETDEDPEENLNSPFVGLNLLRRNQTDKNVFEKTTPKFGDVDKLVVLYLMFINKTHDNGVSIDDLINKENNIGRILNFSRPIINEYLDQLRLKGYIDINRTAGLDMVYFKGELNAKQILIDYYTQEANL